MNYENIYARLTPSLQNLACSLYGYKLKEQRFNKDFYAIRKFLDSTSSWNPDQILSYKEDNIHRIIHHAYNHCPYYKQKYSSVGLSPADFKSIDDLLLFPELTKEEIRMHWKEMLADNIPAGKLIQYHTSGSTGTALNFYWTQYSTQFYWAVVYRYMARFGVKLGDRYLTLTGKTVVPISISQPPYWRKNTILNQYFINMQHITKDKIKSITDFINQTDFKYFTGYPSILYQLSLQIEEAGLIILNSPKHIFTGAEKLYEYQRNQIARTFKGCEIHEHYSFSEEAASASQCTDNKYHEDFELGHFELASSVQNEGEESGELLATGFANYGMPFIRYRNGDTAIFDNHPCPCHLKSQIIKEITGRIEDYILTPEGIKIMRFDYLFKDTHDIKECQIVQTKPNEITLRIVRRNNYSVQTENNIRKQVKHYISLNMQVLFEYVSEIPRTKAGKFKAVVSELIHPQQ
ncbi:MULTISPECIES: phenylacetate--CoA ligase family protein [Parabacteroides]|uniref:phenylacetate--CoA ligase family protein n=1 Tax=Parabacteroides leei TaxID=2939491 RepID=UPI001898565C|nr:MULTISPECIES: phenylacetate--CoA ligase family protein [Parabacteroides]MCL3849825.1 phenylacetate--CoA ligase family protein [Parabacteroides leei]